MAPIIYQSNFEPVPTADRSIFTHLFEDTNTYPPDRPAFIDASNGNAITRRQLKELALSLAYGFRNRVTAPPAQHSKNKSSSTLLSRGDTIMICSPNSLSWPVVLFGAVAAGLRITLAPSSATPRELSWQWVDSRARILVVAPTLLKTAQEMFKLTGVTEEEASRRIWVMDRLWLVDNRKPTGICECRWLGDLIREGQLQEAERFDGKDADETVYICYSSGTTGRPKGVESSHRGVGSVISMAWRVFQSIQTERDVTMALLPFYHIFGLVSHLHHSFLIGAPAVIMTEGFEPTSFCKAIEKYQITIAMVVPPIMLVLSQHPAVEKHDLRSLTAVISGAAPLSPALASNFAQKLKQQGANPFVMQGYGSTETTLTVTVIQPEASISKFGSVGTLVPNLEARLIKESEENGPVMDTEEGEPGELWLRGPTMMKGYLHNPEATKASFEDGWYKTGDILRRDKEGYYYVVDRKKELIKYKGLQVAPAELEAVLLENAEVMDVGVIGVMDAYSGDELPRAYAVPLDRSVLESPTAKACFEERVQKWIEGRVAQHKKLRGGVVAIAAVPKSPTGKILRRELRELAKTRDGIDRVHIKAKL